MCRRCGCDLQVLDTKPCQISDSDGVFFCSSQCRIGNHLSQLYKFARGDGPLLDGVVTVT